MALKRGDVPQFDAVSAAQVTVGTSPAALDSLNMEPSGLAALQADPTNAGNISLGGSGGQYWTLTAGASFPFLVPITNLNLLYGVATQAGQKLNVIAFK